MSDMNDWNTWNVIAEFRASEGRVGGNLEGGAPAHPSWCHNLVTAGEATIEVGIRTIPVLELRRR